MKLTSKAALMEGQAIKMKYYAVNGSQILSYVHIWCDILSFCFIVISGTYNVLVHL